MTTPMDGVGRTAPQTLGMEMNVGGTFTLGAIGPTAKRSGVTSARSIRFLLLFIAVLASAPAIAVDGCLVLLCFAAPSWRAIPQCVPPIRQVLRDLARGRVFPTCGMSGPGNTANHRWASAPGFCPPQYTQLFAEEGTPIYTCRFAGAVSVNIEGALWARTWWNMAGETATEFMPQAKRAMGTWDTRFDDEASRQLGALPAATPVCNGC